VQKNSTDLIENYPWQILAKSTPAADYKLRQAEILAQQGSQELYRFT